MVSKLGSSPNLSKGSFPQVQVSFWEIGFGEFFSVCIICVSLIILENVSCSKGLGCPKTNISHFTKKEKHKTQKLQILYPTGVPMQVGN